VDATITRGVPTVRGLKLKERLLSSPYEVDIERARFYTKTWKETEDAGPCMRAARALEETLRHMTIGIDDDELLVGMKTAKRLAGVIPVERGEFNTVIQYELDRLTTRDRHRFHISDEERRELMEDILPYWQDKTVRGRKMDLWKEEDIYETPMLGPVSIRRIIKGMGLKNAIKMGKLAMGGSLKSATRLPAMMKELAGVRPNIALTVFDVQGHLVPGHKRVLELGMEGIAEWAERRLNELNDEERDYEHKVDFLDSVQVAARAVIDHSKRYVDLAEEMAREAQGERKTELKDIAERCRRVPAKPPRTFMEALQSIWMTQVAMCISYGMAEILSLGRVDQYLYPYYKADLEEGRIDRDKALEAVEDFYVKLATFLIMLVEIGKETASEMGVGSNTITIGGLDREGNDATNEISHLLLEANENLRALANNLCVRISSKTPRDFLVKACESHLFTSGQAFFNDEVIVGELVKDGYTLEDARDYSIVGCVEPTSTGNSFACTAGNDISLAGVLEMTLNEGRTLLSGQRVGAPTPDPCTFKTFEDVKEAFLEQLSFNIDKLVRAVELKDKAYAEAFPSPLVSATLEGCLESGEDMTRGGAKYNYGSVTGRGLGTVADSLAAIRWAVFEKELLTMKELIHHIRSNFKDAEPLRQELSKKAPKYGTDDKMADELSRWVTEHFCDEVRKHRCSRGGFYRPGIFSYGVHVLDGMSLGATPDGRKAGAAVSNGISPVNGTESCGPTAVMQSAASAGGVLLSDGTALNLRLSPALLRSEENTDKLAAMIEAYFALGGRHVQFNVVDTATLQDAQVHPERYPDLVVRVSGYCAYFTDLGRSIQNDIISRTQFDHL
jgi:pyruvate formate-lyase/glycerol dehydratase family glycyl radical enzyme